MNVCLIGYNLTNFLLGLLLSKKGFKVDIIFEDKKIIKNTNRTVGISKNNIDFIKSFFNISNQYLWPIRQIEVFNLKYDPQKKIKFKDKKNENFYLLKYYNLFKLTETKCKQLKNKNFKKMSKKQILMLEKKNKYNFVLNSQINNILTKKFFSNRIKKDYKATAYTAILDHKKINNYTAVQIFTKYGPLAFLPFSKNKTSIVFSVQRKFGLKLNQIKDEILKYSKTYNIEKIFDLETFNLEYSFPRKLIHKNIICFGDNLHKIHPLAGQGFNMSLRDIKLISDIIDDKLNYGLEIGKSTLIEFNDKSKHLNFIFGVGINLINDFFNLDSKLDGIFTNNILGFLNNNEFFIRNSIFFANEGLKFSTE